MFNDTNFYVFILLFLFAVLLLLFNSFVPHPFYIDLLVGILLIVPIISFAYLLKFQNANMTPFYLFFSAILVLYVLVFVGVRMYTAFHR